MEGVKFGLDLGILPVAHRHGLALGGGKTGQGGVLAVSQGAIQLRLPIEILGSKWGFRIQPLGECSHCVLLSIR
jgi:hypothetical protein